MEIVMAKLRIMSHNQWKVDNNQPEWKAKGMDCSSEVRVRGFAQVFAETQPDIIGCQEVSAKMADYMVRFSAEKGLNYALLWGRDTPIVYRPDKFELVDSVFSVYPDECPGFEGVFNNELTKSYCIAVFRIKENGKLLIFATTHLWWKSSDPTDANYLNGSDEARAYQMGLVIEQITKLQEKYNCPAVLVGDMNSTISSQAIKRAYDEGFSHGHDIAVEYADNTIGHHQCGNWGYSPYSDATYESAIDHVLIRGAADGFVRRFDRYQPEYYLPLSDHAPMFIDVEI